MNKIAKSGFAFGAAAIAFTLGTGQAQALPTGHWDFTNRTGDIAGAWSYGDINHLSSGRWQITGNAKDTISDGKGAALEIWVDYNDGGSRREVVMNTLGHGKTVSFDFNYASNASGLIMRECLITKTSSGALVLSPCSETWREFY